MKKLILRVIILMSLLALSWQTMPLTFAQGPELGGEARVVVGNDLTLAEGEVIDQDVVVFGGSFTMEDGSEVAGDVVVLGGNVEINGEVKGDVAGIGGNVEIEEDAIIKGNVISMGGSIEIDEDANISGSVTDGFSGAPTPKTVEPVSEQRTHFSFFRLIGTLIGDGIEDIFMALIMSGLSLLILLFFPLHIKTIKETLTSAAPISFTLGIITFAATFALIFLLVLFSWLLIPICGIFIVVLAWAVAVLTGWVVVGQLLGKRIFEYVSPNKYTETSATLLGVALLTLVTQMPLVDELPLIGWMFGVAGFLIAVLASSMGLGAVVLSRFGTQIYQNSAVASMLDPDTSATDVSGENDVMEGFDDTNYM